MKAVNLIPGDGRGRAAGGGSGIGSYVLLGVLALVVAVGAAYTLVNRSLSDRRHELTTVQARAQASEAQAQALERYTTFAALSAKRAETVRSLAASRFDWSHALHEVSRTMPSYAWLTSMRATVTPSSGVEGGSTDPLRTALANPAIELVGCTTSPGRVAAVISNLRRIDGVDRVSLSSAVKGDDTSTSASPASDGASSSASGDCRHGNARFPQFSMTLFFTAPAGAVAKAAPATTPAPTTGTTKP